jgi:hypothetical protein
VSRSIKALLVLPFLATALFAQTAATPGPKPAGVKRIGVYVAGESADAVREEVLSLLKADETVVQVVALTTRVEVLRLNEAKKAECDYILETNFEVKKGGGGAFGALGGLADKARKLNGESEGLGNSRAKVQSNDKKADSAGNIADILSTDAGDNKIGVTYKLLSVTTNKSLAQDDKSLKKEEVSKFLEGMLNTVLTKILQ